MSRRPCDHVWGRIDGVRTCLKCDQVDAVGSCLAFIHWLRQTLHHAHHEGEVDGCKRATCSSTRVFLEEMSRTRAKETT